MRPLEVEVRSKNCPRLTHRKHTFEATTLAMGNDQQKNHLHMGGCSIAILDYQGIPEY
jgi:hypothetical protein